MASTTPGAALPYPTLPDTPDVPRDVKALADAVDALLGVPSCTSTTRPSTALYEGRMVYETDTKRVARWNGAAWKYVSLQVCQGAVLTHNYGGGIGPVSTSVTFPVPFTAQPAVSLGCNDPRFTLFYGGLSTSGFTASSQASSTGITLALSVSWLAIGLVS